MQQMVMLPIPELIREMFGRFISRLIKLGNGHMLWILRKGNGLLSELHKKLKVQISLTVPQESLLFQHQINLEKINEGRTGYSM